MGHQAGERLYAEAVDLENLTRRARKILTDGVPRKGAWRALVDDVLEHLGEATLPQIYEAIEPRRPTKNQWWREKIRQQLQLHHRMIRPGVWAYKETA